MQYNNVTSIAAYRLKHFISELRKEQSKALAGTIYLPMSAYEAKEYAYRQRLIAKLLRELSFQTESH